MTSRIFAIATAAVVTIGAAAATPALAATPAPLGRVAPAPATDTANIVPVNHLNRWGPYCRRQYRLGFALGRRGARVFFYRHCRRHWRGHWDRGYRGGWRRHPGHYRHHRANPRFGR